MRVSVDEVYEKPATEALYYLTYLKAKAANDLALVRQWRNK